MATGRQVSFVPSSSLASRQPTRRQSVCRNVRDGGLTPRQFAVLQAVPTTDGLSQTDIMAATAIDRSSTAELVRRLVSSGCLQRRRTRNDTRMYAVRLTLMGRGILARQRSGRPHGGRDVVVGYSPRRARGISEGTWARCDPA